MLGCGNFAPRAVIRRQAAAVPRQDAGGPPTRRYGQGVLRGRDEQQAAIDALLGRVRAGISGAVVLRGEPGT